MWTTIFLTCFQQSGPTGGDWFFRYIEMARAADRELNIQS